MSTSQEQSSSATPLLHRKQNQGITQLKASDATSDIQQLSKAQCTTHKKSPIARMNTHQTCRGSHLNQVVSSNKIRNTTIYCNVSTLFNNNLKTQTNESNI